MTDPKKTTLRSFGFIGAGAAGVVAVAIGAAGVAGAQTDEPELTNPESTTAVADHDGSRHGFRNAGALIEQLVEDGVLTQEQADASAEVHEALHTRRQENRAEKAEGLADALGMSVEELQAAKDEGQTLAEIAGDNVDALVDYLAGVRTDQIEQAVADGRITQERADERLEGLEDRISDRIENGGGFGRRDARRDGRRDRAPHAGLDAATDVAPHTAPDAAEVSLT